MVPGPCEGSYFHYGFNSDRGICEQFKYGGCLGEATSTLQWNCNSLISGNNNKFKTNEECDDTCVENEFKMLLLDKCEQPIEEGPWYVLLDSDPTLLHGIFLYKSLNVFSAGNFTRFGYDKESETCEEFNYGGCKGNYNSFMSLSECENSCKNGGGSRAMCLLPR